MQVQVQEPRRAAAAQDFRRAGRGTQAGRGGHVGQQGVHGTARAARGPGQRWSLPGQVRGWDARQAFKEQGGTVAEVRPANDPGHRDDGGGRRGGEQFPVQD